MHVMPVGEEHFVLTDRGFVNLRHVVTIDCLESSELSVRYNNDHAAKVTVLPDPEEIGPHVSVIGERTPIEFNLSAAEKDLKVELEKDFPPA
jgi:hypothetical protein